MEVCPHNNIIHKRKFQNIFYFYTNDFKKSNLMNIKNIFGTFLFICFIVLGSFTNAQTKAEKSPQDTLRVGVAGSEPFVFGKDESEKGVAVEIWEKMAREKKWNYKLIPFESVDNALSELENGKLDVVAGPISITAKRIESVRFSQPYYNSSLAIVSRADNLSFWEKIKPLFSLKLLMAVLFFLIILAIVGTLFWFAERKKSDQFPNDPLNGVGTGMWLAIVTMSTTGYGDKAPITKTGRIIAGCWMIISIIFATSMVAGIASTLTLSSLGSSTVSNIEELSGKKAATITASPSESFLKENKVTSVGVDNLDEAIAKLKNKEVDAVVYDRPQLLYYVKEQKDENLFIAKAEYYKQGYGFAFPLESELVYGANRALLKLSENLETQDIITTYLDKDE